MAIANGVPVNMGVAVFTSDAMPYARVCFSF